jgi:hypothetical protein
VTHGTGADLLSTIRALEAQAADFERRAAELRGMAAGLRAMLGEAHLPPKTEPHVPSKAEPSEGSVPTEDSTPTPRGAPAEPVGVQSLAEAAAVVVSQAGTPLHHTEISKRLEVKGVPLQSDPEKRRLAYIHAATRFPNLLQRGGGGTYTTGDVQAVARAIPR